MARVAIVPDVYFGSRVRVRTRGGAYPPRKKPTSYRYYIVQLDGLTIDSFLQRRNAKKLARSIARETGQ